MTVEPAHPPALRDLAERACGYAEAASSANTRKAYAADWKHFAGWCRRKNAVSTIARRLSALVWAYAQRGLALDRRNRHVATVLAGIRNSHAAPPRQKSEITGLDVGRDQTADRRTVTTARGHDKQGQRREPSGQPRPQSAAAGFGQQIARNRSATGSDGRSKNPGNRAGKFADLSARTSPRAHQPISIRPAGPGSSPGCRETKAARSCASPSRRPSRPETATTAASASRLRHRVPTASSDRQQDRTRKAWPGQKHSRFSIISANILTNPSQHGDGDHRRHWRRFRGTARTETPAASAL